MSAIGFWSELFRRVQLTAYVQFICHVFAIQVNHHCRNCAAFTYLKVFGWKEAEGIAIQIKT
jgi:hypothetical protein